jgi:penicillin-binding protein 1A
MNAFIKNLLKKLIIETNRLIAKAPPPVQKAYYDALQWAYLHRHGLKRTAQWGGGVVGIPLLLLFLLPYLLWPFAARLDSSQDLYSANRPLAFTFLDAQGEVVGRSGAIVGERLKLEDMPGYLPAAFIAMEDQRFYDHIGIDAQGMLRALLKDIRARHVVAGGSTISQQTAKIVFTNSERSFARKLSDMLGAESLEKTYTKKQILELYLNRLYLGSGAYGVDGAAHVYYGKSAKTLSLSEAAMLAALTTSPSASSPRRNLRRAQKRASLVLEVMADQGIITKAEAEEAKAHPADISDSTSVNARNYYLDAAAEEAQRRAEASGQKASGDLTVRTVFDPRIQEAARKAAETVVNGPQGQKAKASEAAVVVMKPDGGVVALIGGVDYAESSFNRAIQAHRQPGSAFKPFIYLAALEAGMTPWDVRDDSSVTIDGWTPTNFGGKIYGSLTLNDALTHSVNTIAAKLAQEVGLSAVVEAAKRSGIVSPLKAHASLALGTSEVTPLELTSAYATFAAGGIRAHPYYVTEVKDGTGHVLYRRKDPVQERVIASHIMRDLTAMLYSVVTSGTGGRAGIWTHEAAGKTGTTQDYHDAWFVGFTTDYVTAVWVGNDDASPMNNVTGGTLPSYIWRDVMKAAEAHLPARALDRSAPYMPVDEDMMASGIPAIDDEAPTPAPAAETPASAPAASTAPREKEKKGFFNWLLGGKTGQDEDPSGGN